MKYLGIKAGRLIESFVVMPSIDITWMWKKSENDYKKIYDVRFSWFFWYFTIGQISKYLKEQGYY